ARSPGGASAGARSPGGASPPVQRSAPASWDVPPELDKQKLDGVLRAVCGLSWASARRLVETGKVRVSGELVTQPTRRVRAGDPVAIDERAPRPRVAAVLAAARDLVVYADPALVVIDKPAGMSTIPYGDEDSAQREDTLDALVRDVLARKDKIRGRAPLGVVQRLDKETSGLIVFARTFAAKKHLTQQLRTRTMGRVYLAIAHGVVRAQTHRSLLAPDRGDGLRGTRRHGKAKPAERGEEQLAVTHVEPLEALAGATLVRCRLETGRTHQIRIHLSEAGNPLVGERVYVREFRGTPIPAPRLMLHATEVVFEHPQHERPMRFERPPPADFAETLARLRRR
ncbi:MAG: RluA family pseudouridine synthase, partial [Polyangiaceae bacterium]